MQRKSSGACSSSKTTTRQINAGANQIGSRSTVKSYRALRGVPHRGTRRLLPEVREKIGTERRRCGESRLPGAGTALGRPTPEREQGALVPVHIYRASCRGDQRTVRKLQRLLIKSKSAKLLAVRRVTQDNQDTTQAISIFHPTYIQVSRSGKEVALPSPPPLRTARARFPRMPLKHLIRPFAEPGNVDALPSPYSDAADSL
jgi:hypothetical protein